MSKRSRAMRRREEACKFAAMLVRDLPDVGLIPRLWSTVVFFESYLTYGADGTKKDFGPKKPKKLKVVGASK